jgi:hypothetical protein
MSWELNVAEPSSLMARMTERVLASGDSQPRNAKAMMAASGARASYLLRGVNLFFS